MAVRLYFTVTNDLVFDQRMIRICTSLAGAGYDITLVGAGYRDSPTLGERPFRQHRLKMWSRRGKRFYAEYNLRLFLYLLFKKMDGVCAIDLDTIFPVYLVSGIRRLTRIYDAHELFCEMQEVVSRPLIYKVWKRIERICVPRFRNGYTVNGLIAAEFHNMYGVDYAVIRNMPLLRPDLPGPAIAGALPPGPFILYQGAVNEGRCFETLIPAMKDVKAPLLVCGEGNFMTQARHLVRQYGLEEKVFFKGRVRPEELRAITQAAYAGITLFERRGISNFYSLANRFFDYIHAGIPQIAVDYPAYREINNSAPVAVLIDEPGIGNIASALNKLLDDTGLYKRLADNCKQVRLRYNWQEEEKALIRLYHHFFD